MLFLFRGRNGPLVRAIAGVLFIGIGIGVVTRSGEIPAAVGAVLLAWGGIGALSTRRVGRRTGNGGLSS